jgi:hypothetical protein
VSRYITYCGAFDSTAYGSCDIAWTDASGAHTITLTPGTYLAGPHAVSMGVAGIGDFTATLVAQMDAATAQTVTGGFSETTGLITLACTGGTFTLSFPGAAGLRMQALLGFNGAITGLTSYTGSNHPLYVLKPYLPCVTAYGGPAKESGRSTTKSTSDGSMYTLKPATIRRIASWRHDFEPKSMVDRDVFDNISYPESLKNSYTWEDLWDDYGDHRLPIFAIFTADDNSVETLCFDLTTDDFDKTTHAQMSSRDDVRWKVMIAASIRARSVSP